MKLAKKEKPIEEDETEKYKRLWAEEAEKNKKIQEEYFKNFGNFGAPKVSKKKELKPGNIMKARGDLKKKGDKLSVDTELIVKKGLRKNVKNALKKGLQERIDEIFGKGIKVHDIDLDFDSDNE